MVGSTSIHRAELEKGDRLAHQALEIAVRLGDPVLEMLASSTAASAGLLLGRPRPDLMARARELAATTPGPRLGRGPVAVHGRHCLWGGQLREARTILEALSESIVRAGLEFQRPYRILDLAGLEIAAGNLRLAADLVDEGMEAAADAGNPQAGAWLSYPLGVVSAHRGDDDHVTAAAVVLRSRVNEQDGRTRLLMADHVLGLAALAAGAPAKAVAALAPALALAREIGVRLPSVVPVLPDAIEAAALAGDVDGCQALAAELVAMAEDIRQPWVDAAALRARGLVALAAGSPGAADLLGAAADVVRRARLPRRRRPRAAAPGRGTAGGRAAGTHRPTCSPTPIGDSPRWTPRRGRPRPKPSSSASRPDGSRPS